MTIEELEQSGWIILKCISGSRAYGLDIATSDTDIKGVFVLPKEQYFGLDYIPQIANETNDIVYYELGRFIELLSKNNPNILELLATPTDKIIYQHPILKQLKPDLFLSKKCKDSFGGYAYTQIRKAQGLNKKIVNPVAKEKKRILDFCYVLYEQGSIKLDKWLDLKGLQQESLGLVAIPHAKGMYGIYADEAGVHNYKGVLKKVNATTVCLSSIPKGQKSIGYLSYNQDGYIKYCKDYKNYWDWVDKRNEARYLNTTNLGKNYDTKNMMHTFRLLDMALEILRDQKIVVKRPNRAELLSIRNGEWEYEALIKMADAKMQTIQNAYQDSALPNKPDLDAIQHLLVKIRQELYA